MKKYIVLITTLIITIIPAYSASSDSNWSEFGDLERAWDGQKPVTNQEFEKVMEHLEAPKKKKEARKKLKGDSHNQFDAGQELLNIEENNALLNIPVGLMNEEYRIMPGHYKVTANKNKNGVNIEFYQSHKLMAKFPAIETNDDFEQPTINFVQYLPLDENKIKIIYGSLDFNAYSIIDMAPLEY